MFKDFSEKFYEKCCSNSAKVYEKQVENGLCNQSANAEPVFALLSALPPDVSSESPGMVEAATVSDEICGQSCGVKRDISIGAIWDMFRPAEKGSLKEPTAILLLLGL